MASTKINVVAKTYDPSLTDLTAMTGGNSLTVGNNQSDWVWYVNTNSWGTITNATPDNISSTPKKRTGGEQIHPTLYADDGGALPTLSTAGAALTLTHEIYDNLNTETTGSNSGGLGISIGSSRINCGIYYTFALKTSLQTFWWMGTYRNGQFTVTISISDGSKTPVTLVLPAGAINTAINGWFEATWQGTADQVAAGVTVQIKINRDTVVSAIGSMTLRGQVLRIPTPAAVPRGRRARRRH